MPQGNSLALSMKGSRDGTAFRALASHQCGPGTNPEPKVTCGLNLLLILAFF